MEQFEIEDEVRRLDAMLDACRQVILDECARDRNWRLAVLTSTHLFARLCAAAGMSDADIRAMLDTHLASGEHRRGLPTAVSRMRSPH